MSQSSTHQSSSMSEALVPPLSLDDVLASSVVENLTDDDIDSAVFSGLAASFGGFVVKDFTIDDKPETSNILESSGTVLSPYRRHDLTEEEKEKYWSKF